MKKEKIIFLEEFRRDPVKDYQEKYQNIPATMPNNEAWEEMADMLYKLNKHLELGGSVLAAQKVIAELTGYARCCSLQK